MSTRIARLLSYSGIASLLVTGCSRGASPSVAAGQLLYAESGCGSCHGKAGDGRGPIASTLDPAPTDLRHGMAFKSSFDEVSLAEMLATGIATHNHPADATVDAHHNQGMPPFPHLSDTERRSLALYVMSLNTDPR